MIKEILKGLEKKIKIDKFDSEQYLMYFFKFILKIFLKSPKNKNMNPTYREKKLSLVKI